MINTIFLLGGDITLKDNWNRTIYMLLIQNLWLEQHFSVYSTYFSQYVHPNHFTPLQPLEDPSRASNSLMTSIPIFGKSPPVNFSEDLIIAYGSRIHQIISSCESLSQVTQPKRVDQVESKPQPFLLPKEITWFHRYSPFPTPHTTINPVLMGPHRQIQPRQLQGNSAPTTAYQTLQSIISYRIARNSLFSELYLKLMLLNNVYYSLSPQYIDEMAISASSAMFQPTTLIAPLEQSEYQPSSLVPPANINLTHDTYNIIIDRLVALKPRSGNSSSTERGSDGTKRGPTRGEKFRKRFQLLLIQRYVDHIYTLDQNYHNANSFSIDTTNIVDPEEAAINISQQTTQQQDHDAVMTEITKILNHSITLQSNTASGRQSEELNIDPKQPNNHLIAMKPFIVDLFDAMLDKVRELYLKQMTVLLARSEFLREDIGHEHQSSAHLMGAFDDMYLDALFVDLAPISPQL